MVNPTERRSTSELDISSMRRISDALLLAQNRARRATDRANHAEHIMRLVLTRLGVPRLHINSLADEETVRAAVSSTSFSSMISPQQRSSIIDVIEPEDTLSELCHSVQMMAGFLAGVLVGVVVTKHWQMHVMRPQSETPSLFSKLACWCSGRVPVPGTPWHLIPLPMDGYHYLMNEILEVV
ncbi:hypothetical protein PsorP6_010847 [Peronosclerospora sorghi]|uniref:Uncharacterized protein n=1 Tax=Peronosclerospora sorghi TaxID=230839 RepID=A0ACC0VU08_9STRA|nr:hypothetical protein PsorP6_010847 [Peronosclerospora sorghi]